jgi:hypothetical protein
LLAGAELAVPLVSLGNCNVTTARRLVAVLNASAGARQPTGAELRWRAEELKSAVRDHLSGGGSGAGR